jgi:hypothetical protein
MTRKPGNQYNHERPLKSGRLHRKLFQQAPHKKNPDQLKNVFPGCGKLLLVKQRNYAKRTGYNNYTFG